MNTDHCKDDNAKTWFDNSNPLGSALIKVKNYLEDYRVNKEKILQQLQWFKTNIRIDDKKFNEMLNSFNISLNEHCKDFHEQPKNLKILKETYRKVIDLFFPDPYFTLFSNTLDNVLQC